MGTVSKMPRQPRKPATDNRKPEERFVDEFMIDRDPIAAAIRTGVASIQLEKKVKAWMANPDIRRAIQARTDVADLETIITPQRIIAGFIDVAFDPLGTPASKNAALRELALLYRMYPAKEDPDKKKKRNNVMFVPAPMDPTDWNTVAMAAQQKLKDDVRD